MIEEQQDVNAIIKKYQSSEMEWAKFCFMPDLVEPVKMPSLFPIPTHLCRRRLTKTITVGGTASGSIQTLVWAPEHYHGLGVLCGQHNASVAAGPAYNNFWEDTTDNWSQGFSPDQPRYHYTGALQDGISTGGQRLIGAFMRLEYLGKIDDISGKIEIGLNINSFHHGKISGQSDWHRSIKFSTSDQIQQMPFYSCVGLSEGARAIWFPIDTSKFEFETGTRIEKMTFDSGTGLPNSFPNPQTIEEDQAGPGYDFSNYQDPVRIEWHIRFVGVQTEVPVRIRIQQFYETVPNETVMDNYYPKKSKTAGEPDDAMKAVHKISKEIPLTGPLEHGVGIAKSLISKLDDYQKRFFPILTGAAAELMAPGTGFIGYGIGSGLTTDFSGTQRYRR